MPITTAKTTTRPRALTGALIALTIGLSSCGSTSHAVGGNTPGDSSGWPASLNNSKVGALYNSANNSSTIVDCVPASDPAASIFTQSHVDIVGTSNGGPSQSELVNCSFDGPRGGASIFLGPVGVPTWTDPADLTPSALRVAKVIPGSGILSLPDTKPDGWQWQLSFAPAGLSPAATLKLAHAVADNLAH